MQAHRRRPKRCLVVLLDNNTGTVHHWDICLLTFRHAFALFFSSCIDLFCGHLHSPPVVLGNILVSLLSLRPCPPTRFPTWNIILHTNTCRIGTQGSSKIACSRTIIQLTQSVHVQSELSLHEVYTGSKYTPELMFCRRPFRCSVKEARESLDQAYNSCLAIFLPFIDTSSCCGGGTLGCFGFIAYPARCMTVAFGFCCERHPISRTDNTVYISGTVAS